MKTSLLSQARLGNAGGGRGWVGLIALLIVGLGMAAPGSAWALGLLVLKGANASPEFAKVVTFSRCEEFAVNYKVQVTGGGEKVYLISEVFGMVEYDPVLLAVDLVDLQDYAPLLEVVDRTRRLEARYPAVRQESPRFLKPILEVMLLRDQGLVQYEGRWMTRASYDRVKEEQRQKVKDTRAMTEALERTRKLEIQRQEEEAKAMLKAAANRVKAEEQARMEEEERRRAAQRKMEEEQEKEARLLAEKRAQEEKEQSRLRVNWNRLGGGPTAALLKAEWETLQNWHRAGRETFPGMELPGAAEALLMQQHFAKGGTDLPAAMGSTQPATWVESADGRSLMIRVVRTAEAGASASGVPRSGLLMAFQVPTDAKGGPVAGEELRGLTTVVGDVSRELQRALPRAMTVALTSLPEAGALSLRVPLGVGEPSGYLTVSRPLLGEDGSYHLILLVALGLTDGRAAAPVDSVLR
ncbi:hypothetical protein [Verrucomicrobium spinosum]|nr:hypothetical protein [Verrucomicrobium spinosum]